MGVTVRQAAATTAAVRIIGTQRRDQRARRDQCNEREFPRAARSARPGRQWHPPEGARAGARGPRVRVHFHSRITTKYNTHKLGTAVDRTTVRMPMSSGHRHRPKPRRPKRRRVRRRSRHLTLHLGPPSPNLRQPTCMVTQGGDDSAPSLRPATPSRLRLEPSSSCARVAQEPLGQPFAICFKVLWPRDGG